MYRRSTSSRFSMQPAHASRFALWFIWPAPAYNPSKSTIYIIHSPSRRRNDTQWRTPRSQPVGERKIGNKSGEILPIYITHCRSAILFVALYSCREHAFTVMRVQTRSKSSKTGRICTHFPNRSLIFNLTTMKYNGGMIRPIRCWKWE